MNDDYPFSQEFASGGNAGNDRPIHNANHHPTPNTATGYQRTAPRPTASRPNRPAAPPPPPPPPRRTRRDDLPPQGKYYKIDIFDNALGVDFRKPREVRKTLFLHTDVELLNALGQRPVVGYVYDKSAAQQAGVKLGHILASVNGVDVYSPKDAVFMVKKEGRPLRLEFYIPNTEIMVSEGPFLVKYDTKSRKIPTSLKEWKYKYVVIGGIIAQPWMLHMYRSKADYDRAVMETQSGRRITVKVKQVSLLRSTLQNGMGDPEQVRIKEKPHPWRYISIIPGSSNPVKIAAPGMPQIKPIYEAVLRVLNQVDEDELAELRRHKTGFLDDDDDQKNLVGSVVGGQQQHQRGFEDEESFGVGYDADERMGEHASFGDPYAASSVHHDPYASAAHRDPYASATAAAAPDAHHDPFAPAAHDDPYGSALVQQQTAHGQKRYDGQAHDDLLY